MSYFTFKALEHLKQRFTELQMSLHLPNKIHKKIVNDLALAHNTVIKQQIIHNHASSVLQHPGVSNTLRGGASWFGLGNKAVDSDEERQLLDNPPKTNEMVDLQTQIREINRDIFPLRAQESIALRLRTKESLMEKIFGAWGSQDGALKQLSRSEQNLRDLVRLVAQVKQKLQDTVSSLLPEAEDLSSASVVATSAKGDGDIDGLSTTKHDAILTSLYVNVLESLQHEITRSKRDIEEWRINMSSKSYGEDAMGLTPEQCKQVWCPSSSKWTQEACYTPHEAHTRLHLESRPPKNIRLETDTRSVQTWRDQKRSYSTRRGKYEDKTVDIGGYLNSCNKLLRYTPEQVASEIKKLSSIKKRLLQRLSKLSVQYKNFNSEITEDKLKGYENMTPAERKEFNLTQ